MKGAFAKATRIDNISLSVKSADDLDQNMSCSNWLVVDLLAQKTYFYFPKIFLCYPPRTRNSNNKQIS